MSNESKHEFQDRLDTSTQLGPRETVEYKETKLHYYAGLVFIVVALLGLAIQFRTSRLLFFDSVLAFRESLLETKEDAAAPNEAH